MHKRLTPRRHALLLSRLRALPRCRRDRSARQELAAVLAQPAQPPELLRRRSRRAGSGSGRRTRRGGCSTGRASARFGARIELVCYPRLLGYVFNPLSVYFCRDDAGACRRRHLRGDQHVRRAQELRHPGRRRSTEAIAQTCAKEMYVSPFTGATGHYGFHCIAPSDRVVDRRQLPRGGPAGSQDAFPRRAPAADRRHDCAAHGRAIR